MMETNAASTEQIIERFGGIRPMAAKLNTPVTTVQGWKKRGIIPQARHSDILAVAVRENIVLDAVELAQTDPGATQIREARTSDSGTPQFAAVMPAPVPILPGSHTSAVALTISVFALILSVGAVSAGWYLYLQPLENRVAMLETQKAGDNLTVRVAKLESDLSQKSLPSGQNGNMGDGERIAALEKQLADLKANAAEAEQLAKRLGDLQVAAGSRELLTQSIRDIQSSTAATQGEVERLNSQLGSLGGRIDKVDTALAERRQQTLRTEAVILAVGQLRNALQDFKPFSKEISALRALIGGDTEMLGLLDQIQPLAADGVETAGELRTDFDRLAPKIVRSAVIGDGKSWLRQALYHIESVISVRHVGASVPGDNADAVVARAEAKLDGDDLPGAVSALQMLSGLSADIAQPWIHSAEQRIAADSAESELTRIAIDRIAAGDPPISNGPASLAPPAATEPAQ